MKGTWLWIALMLHGIGWCQTPFIPHVMRTLAIPRDTLVLGFVDFNPESLQVRLKNGQRIDPSLYVLDPQGHKLIWKNKPTETDSVMVVYRPLPDKLTRVYRPLGTQQLIPTIQGQWHRGTPPENPNKPWLNGLNTQGSLVRGVRLGNNQNTSTVSNLDLQISGQLSEKVGIRAYIQDANIPLQTGGYSQRLDQFDQVFIEVFTDKASLKGGDMFLENHDNSLLTFNKKIQGLSGQGQWGSPSTTYTSQVSAGVVRGQYARSQFTGQEGNQGPYKLKGNNGEPYVVIISGSERVYVNGILKKRGENQDYMIDYNAGEIRFTALFPITSEMRINVEYQYSDRNYNRYVAFAQQQVRHEQWELGVSAYTETDIKSQPLQQSLSSDQIAVLREAGNDPDQMLASSAVITPYSENRILYQKIEGPTGSYFEYANNPALTLYAVTFSFIGNNQADYILSNSNANGKIYSYVPPINGQPQGQYAPVVRLVPPTQLQMTAVKGRIHPSDKTQVDLEMALSRYDANLYSSIGDGQNTGGAGKFNISQRLWTGRWNTDLISSGQWIQAQFKTVERIVNIEFNRDWNLLNNSSGHQALWMGGLRWSHAQQGQWTYMLEQLSLGNEVKAQRNSLRGVYNGRHLQYSHQSSWLNSQTNDQSTRFGRIFSQLKAHRGRQWTGLTLRAEDNQQKQSNTGMLVGSSQRFTEWGGFWGRGDSTKVFVQLGMLHRLNDSLQQGQLERVNRSTSYYVRSQLIQNQRSQLSFFAQYRKLQFNDPNKQSLPSFNGRLVYNDQYFNGGLVQTCTYETQSGSLPQQDFTFVKVAPGQGVYMWNDYNGNGIQDLQEFEVAPYPDLALYIKVFLPTTTYVRTHTNKWAQTLLIQPAQWMRTQKNKSFWNPWTNQMAWQLERKIKRDGQSFDLDPTNMRESGLLGLNSSFRNSLFFRRGQQRHSMTYTFSFNQLKNLWISGSQSAKTLGHQGQYTHLIQKTWLINGWLGWKQLTQSADTYSSRNYQIEAIESNPSLQYLFDTNTRLECNGLWSLRKNVRGDERLEQQKIGLLWSMAAVQKWTFNAEFNWIQLKYSGPVSSPAAFQMLEALQPGSNQTWKVFLQKNLNSFLDLNVQYQGRKSENLPVIHTGSVQLRALF